MDKCYLWPCNQATFCIWQRLQTQWNHAGMGERSGLDYSAVIGYLRDIRRIPAKERVEIFHGLQAMELAALEAYAEKQKYGL